MKQLENLAEIADRNLGGLKADAHLLHEIQAKVKEQSKRTFRLRPVLIAGMACALFLFAGLIVVPEWINDSSGSDVAIDSRSAGGELDGQNITLTANVPSGSVTISASSGQTPSYRTLFAAEQNGDIPLIKVGEETYRLLTNPTAISGGLMGTELGQVTEYTLEPSLSTGSIVSNIVSAGETVYAVTGMNGAMIAADVDGSTRVFQRVSYGGTATVGNESLEDVLTGGVTVTAMELSGVGTIDDAATAQALAEVLFANAYYEGAAASANTSQSLLIELENGLVVQMNVGSGRLSACGTWSCPEFFDAFSEALAE